MPLYSLKFEDDDLGESKHIEFRSQNPAEALSVLKDESVRRHVSLWEGEKLLGNLMRDRNGVWHLDEEPVS